MNPLYLFIFVVSALALHLEIPAEQNPKPVCVRDFVGQEQFVVVSIKSLGRVGDGQKLGFTVIDSLGNEYRRSHDVAGQTRAAFTSHHNAAIDICFTNTVTHNKKYNDRGGLLFREVELEIELGAAARDWNAIQALEKLKPIEVDLRRVQEMTEEIADELQYLKQREARMRDTNELTNLRVKWFLGCVIVSLIGLGVWQIQYLRHYFKVKHII